MHEVLAVLSFPPKGSVYTGSGILYALSYLIFLREGISKVKHLALKGEFAL